MATQTVQPIRAATGRTATAKLFAYGVDTVVASVAATEATNRKGSYLAAFTDVAAGEYELILIDDLTGVNLAHYWVTIEAATGNYKTYTRVDNTGIAAANWNSMLVDYVSSGTFGAAVGALSASSGSGARTVTVTVNDGTTVLQNARVRLTNGAETYTGLTNVSGVVVFNVDDADWVVSITKPGYTFAGASLVVDGTEAVTYSMSLVTITPSSTDKVTGYWTVLDENGSAAASVVVTIKARQPLRGGVGIIHDAGERTATSNGSGLVQFTNLIPGWRYAVVANDDYVADFVVPADAVTSVELGSIVARLP